MKFHTRASVFAALLYLGLMSNCAVGDDGEVETDGTGVLPQGSGGAGPSQGGSTASTAGDGGMMAGQGGASVTSTSQSGTTVSSTTVGTTVSTTTVGTTTSATSTGITSSAISSSGTGLPGTCNTSNDCNGDPNGPCCLAGFMICGPDPGIPGACL